MGVEYKLEVGSDVEAAQLWSVLLDLGGTECGSLENMLEFRSQTNIRGMPDAFASTIERGIYFCDNGGCGRAVFERLVAELSTKFGNVLVQEY
jgi:hypothetical protein